MVVSAPVPVGVASAAPVRCRRGRARHEFEVAHGCVPQFELSPVRCNRSSTDLFVRCACCDVLVPTFTPSRRMLSAQVSGATQQSS